MVPPRNPSANASYLYRIMDPSLFSVYVGGLPLDSTDDMLRRHFSSVGEVVETKVIDLCPLTIPKVHILRQRALPYGVSIMLNRIV